MLRKREKKVKGLSMCLREYRGAQVRHVETCAGVGVDSSANIFCHIHIV